MINNQRGSVIITSLVAAVFAGTAFWVAQKWQTGQNTMLMKAQGPISADIMYANVVGNIMSDSSWQVTESKKYEVPPDELKCESLSLPNATNLWSARSEFILDTNCRNIGFAFSGAPCDSFSKEKNEGSDECPFRYELFVGQGGGPGGSGYGRPDGGYSSNPPGLGGSGQTIVVYGSLYFNPRTPLVLNTAKYNFKIERGKGVTSSATTIESLQGICAQIYNSSTFSLLRYEQNEPFCLGLPIQKSLNCGAKVLTWGAQGPGCQSALAAGTNCTRPGYAFSSISGSQPMGRCVFYDTYGAQ